MTKTKEIQVIHKVIEPGQYSSVSEVLQILRTGDYIVVQKEKAAKLRVRPYKYARNLSEGVIEQNGEKMELVEWFEIGAKIIVIIKETLPYLKAIIQEIKSWFEDTKEVKEAKRLARLVK